MKPSEILRSLADLIDAGQQPDPTGMGGIPDNAGSDLAQQPDDVFVPPLQLKLELLKKATGVKNIYDVEPEAEIDQHSYDELDTMKKNAGLGIAVISGLGDDEPFDD